MSEETQITAPGDTRLALLQQALTDPAIDADKLDKLLAVQERWQEGEAKRAYAASLAAFQGDCPIVEKGDKAYDSAYAALDRIWRTVKPLMKLHGLFVTWGKCSVAQGVATIVGQLGHRDGHMTQIEQSVPIPNKGSANDAQKVGSAQTYAKRYALCAALGIVTGEDDDGNAAGGDVITDAQFQVLHAAIEGTTEPEANLDKVLQFGGVDDLRDYPAAMYATALRTVRMKPQAKGQE